MFVLTINQDINVYSVSCALNDCEFCLTSTECLKCADGYVLGDGMVCVLASEPPSNNVNYYREFRKQNQKRRRMLRKRSLGLF